MKVSSRIFPLVLFSSQEKGKIKKNSIASDESLKWAINTSWNPQNIFSRTNSSKYSHLPIHISSNKYYYSLTFCVYKQISYLLFRVHVNKRCKVDVKSHKWQSTAVFVIRFWAIQFNSYPKSWRWRVLLSVCSIFFSY